MVYTTNPQIDLIQILYKLVNEFIWQGQNKVRPTVMNSSYHMGGMNMLRFQDVIHTLKVKWMHQLSFDHGNLWSHYVWGDIIKQIPSMLFQGLCSVTETTLLGLDPFYASMLHSYVMVNNLFYKRNKHVASNRFVGAPPL